LEKDMKNLKLDMHFAAAAALCAAGAANAAVVYSGAVNFVCAIDIDGTYINVETAQLTNGPGSGVPGWDVNPYRASSGSGMNFFSPTGGGMVSAAAGVGSAINLAGGASIGSTSNFSSSTATVVFGSGAGQWQYGTTNIVGFRFVGADGQTRYGWMRFLMGAQPVSGNLVTRTVVDFAYESVAGASILAGDTGIPAPGALALLGVAGLASRRRR
jgi:MYXO-CTERM domain-containing protein